MADSSQFEYVEGRENSGFTVSVFVNFATIESRSSAEHGDTQSRYCEVISL